ncbi:MAG: tetratricopeptide repeat protein [Bacteroidota bacterium]|nr:tetratricopeptide repeat protein [Bacteroidota bacterium]
MKNIFLVVCVFAFAATAFGQPESKVIGQARSLIADKKYESAYKALDAEDPKNNNPEIVLLKEEIVLKYFITSIMHQMFALKDLEKNEDIMDYRGKEGSFGMYVFAPDSVLTRLIKKHPDNYKLYKGLGDFYYDVNLKYPGQWLKEEEELQRLINKNYQIAIDHGLGDDHVFYALGYILLSNKQNKEAIPYFLQSIALKNDFADAHYNLAYAYLFTDDRENAIKYAKNAIDLYKEPELKSDAARIVAQAYVELHDDKNAAIYYEAANTIDTGNYENIKPMLDLYVRTGNPKRADALNAFFLLAPEKPTIYNNLADIYMGYDKTDELISFLKSKLPVYETQKNIYGNLHFYLGKLYLVSDKKTAKQYFLKAKDIFSTVYEKDHAVFKALDEGIEEAETK